MRKSFILLKKMRVFQVSVLKFSFENLWVSALPLQEASN